MVHTILQWLQKPIILFTFSIVALSYIYGIPQILTYPATGAHSWRQTDGLSFALNYYQYDLPFLEPQLHNQRGNHGRTVGEFPIIYYVVSLFYRVFGVHEWIYRLLDYSILVAGMYALFRLIIDITRRVWLSLAIMLISFSSPILVYYSASFIPDTVSFGIALGAAYCLWMYIRYNKSHCMWLTLVLVTLSGLIKVTLLIWYVAFLGVYLIDILFLKNPLFKKEKFIYFLIPLVINFAWVQYSIYYQMVNDHDYFLSTIKPIWSANQDKIIDIYHKLTFEDVWWFQFYLQKVLVVSLVGILLLLFYPLNIRVKIFGWLLILGEIAFIMLFYCQLDAHEYYLINILFVVIFLYVVMAYVVSEMSPPMVRILTIAFLILAGLSIYHARTKVNKRYESAMKEDSLVFTRIPSSTLDSIGLTRDKKILYIGDMSYCRDMYYLNRLGWHASHTSLSSESDYNFFKKNGVSFVVVYSPIDTPKSNFQDSFHLVHQVEKKVYFYQYNHPN